MNERPEIEPCKLTAEGGDLIELAMRTGSKAAVRLAFSIEHFNLLVKQEEARLRKIRESGL